MGTPWEPPWDMGPLPGCGALPLERGHPRAPHSHGCPFSLTPAFPLLLEHVLRKPACSSPTPATAFHVPASLDPLGTKRTRATGTVNFIGLKSAGRWRKQASPSRSFAEFPRWLCCTGTVWLSPLETRGGALAFGMPVDPGSTFGRAEKGTLARGLRPRVAKCLLAVVPGGHGQPARTWPPTGRGQHAGTWSSGR